MIFKIIIKKGSCFSVNSSSTIRFNSHINTTTTNKQGKCSQSGVGAVADVCFARRTTSEECQDKLTL